MAKLKQKTQSDLKTMMCRRVNYCKQMKLTKTVISNMLLKNTSITV